MEYEHTFSQMINYSLSTRSHNFKCISPVAYNVYADFVMIRIDWINKFYIGFMYAYVGYDRIAFHLT